MGQVTDEPTNRKTKKSDDLINKILMEAPIESQLALSSSPE